MQFTKDKSIRNFDPFTEDILKIDDKQIKVPLIFTKLYSYILNYLTTDYSISYLVFQELMSHHQERQRETRTEE